MNINATALGQLMVVFVLLLISFCVLWLIIRYVCSKLEGRGKKIVKISVLVLLLVYCAIFGLILVEIGPVISFTEISADT